jgi:hypothetical protein
MHDLALETWHGRKILILAGRHFSSARETPSRTTAPVNTARTKVDARLPFYWIAMIELLNVFDEEFFIEKAIALAKMEFNSVKKIESVV